MYAHTTEDMEAHDNHYFDSAIEAARLRLSAAEKWASGSKVLLENAQSQVVLSEEELRDAKEHLQRLERNTNVRDVEQTIPRRRLKPMLSVVWETQMDETCLNSCDARSSLDTRTTASMSDSSTTKFLCDYEIDNRHKAEGSDQSLEEMPLAEEDSSKSSSKNGSEAMSKANMSDSSSSTEDSETITIVDKTPGHGSSKSVEVTGCGISTVNGKYHQFEHSDGIPSYSKIDIYEGKEAIYTISRWASGDGMKKWYITADVPGGSQPKKIVFYVAYAPSFVAHPPKKSWMVVNESDSSLPAKYQCKGVGPVPVLVHDAFDMNGCGQIRGIQILSTCSSKSRKSGRSSFTDSRRRRQRETSRKNKSL